MSYSQLIEIEDVAEFCPAVRQEAYVKMMPKHSQLEIALYAAGLKQGDDFMWAKSEKPEGSPGSNSKVLKCKDATPLAAVTPEQLFAAIKPASGW